MLVYDSCKPTLESCMKTKTFSMARLYNDERTMNIHLHDCYEIYFSISGGKQFLIDDTVYEFEPGDLFFINKSESHGLLRIDQRTHERIVLFIYPEYLQQLSTAQTDLSSCFQRRSAVFGHRIGMSEKEQGRFNYYMHRLSESRGFGQDIMDQAAFLELMTFLNSMFLSRCAQLPVQISEGIKHSFSEPHYAQVDKILSYIHLHLSEDLSIQHLAAQFYLSSSYLCKIFKDVTGTTINRYIIDKRISLARTLLAEGRSVTETGSLCGFHDYSNFIKAFTKNVGVSPKKYAACGH